MITITCLTENATVINRCVRADWFCGHGIVCWFDAITPAVFLIFLCPTALAKGMIVQPRLLTCAVIHTHTHMWYVICLSPMLLLFNLACVFFFICARCSQVLSVWMKNTVKGKLQAKYLLEVNDIGNHPLVHRFVCACVCNHVYLPYFTCHDIEKHLLVLLRRSLAL